MIPAMTAGDFIIDLPPDTLDRMDGKVGDSLSVELVSGAIVLTAVRDTGHKF